MHRFNHPLPLHLTLVLVGMLALSACTDDKTAADPQQTPPPVSEAAAPPPGQGTEPAAARLQALPHQPEQGLRAYVDPVTGEYTPAPPPAPAEPDTDIPGAALITSGTKKAPQEIPLPQGGVMIELGDEFQTPQQAPEK